MKNGIELKQLSKKYPLFTLKEINMEVPKGSIMGFVGENGAGKTTTLKLILNIIKKDGGTIKINGLDHLKEEKAIKEKIGAVLDDSFFSEYLTPLQVSKIMKQFFKTWDQPLFQKYLQQFELPPKKAVKTFSRGMKMKLQIITALSHHPEILLLDEPTSGLDPIVRSEILELFRAFMEDENHTILLSSHITSDLEQLADYITFIHKGEIIFSTETDVLIHQYGVLKCSKQDFDSLKKEDIIRYKQNKFGYEVLVSDYAKMKKQFPDAVLDRANIEAIMLYYIKGEQK